MNIFSFFAGSFRLSLFVSSVILMILSMMMGSQALVANNFYVMLGALDWSTKSNWFLFGSVYLAGVAVLGLFGSFYNHQGLIKIFGLLTALNGFLCLAVLLGLPDKQIVNDRFEDIMLKAQKEYQWIPDSSKNNKLASLNDTIDKFHNINPDQEPRDPNKLWDTLQRSYFCCGLHDKSEWYQYSPIYQVLPPSCCMPHEQSTITEIKFCQYPGLLWNSSCIDTIGKPAFLIFYILILVLVLNLFFSMLAFMVSCCSSCDHNSTSYMRDHMAYPSSQIIGSSLHNGYMEPHLIITNNIPPCQCPLNIKTKHCNCPPSYLQASLYPNLDEKHYSTNYGSLN